MNTIKVLIKFDIPLVGPRGGKIPHSLNSMKPSPHRRAPVWAIYKRCKMHYLKHVPLNKEYGLTAPIQGIIRHVQFIRLIPKRGRLLDHDNFVGGLKPLRDCLIEQGWIYDDDKPNLRAYYKQDPTTEVEITTVRVTVGADMEEEYKFRGKVDTSVW